MVLFKLCLVDLDLRRSKSGSSNELELRIANEFSCQPEKGLFEVVVGLGRNVVILEIFLSVESNGLGFDFSLLNIDFVSSEDDGDVFADSDEIT